jgi:hypothetical protein
MVRGAGFEPAALSLKVNELHTDTHTRAHTLSVDLAEVVEIWCDIPEAVKAGILAIVRAYRTSLLSGDCTATAAKRSAESFPPSLPGSEGPPEAKRSVLGEGAGTGGVL